MQDLTITLAQVNQFWEDKQKNLDHFTEVLSGIEKTDLILLPEMFHTGFSMNAAALAEENESSPALDWLKKTAEEKDAAVYTSYIAKENGRFYNRGVFAEPNGNVTVYDKRKRFAMAGEHEVFSAGEKAVIVEYKGWKINLQICYDLRFPEISRNRPDEKGEPLYDLCLYVANWPGRRIEHWKALLPARAIENQCYVAAVNRVGTDDNKLEYPGESGVYDPSGKLISNHVPNDVSIFKAYLSVKNIKEFRKNLPFLKDY